MKNITIVLLCLIITGSLSYVYAQENDNLSTFSSAGALSESPGIMLNWTIGEGLINLHRTNKLNLNEGFHQLIVDEMTSVEDGNIRQLNLTVYPNPAFDELTINSGTNIIREIKVTDLRGNTIFLNNDVMNSEFTVDVSSFTAGTYFLEITTDDNTIKEFKIQKSN